MLFPEIMIINDLYYAVVLAEQKTSFTCLLAGGQAY